MRAIVILTLLLLSHIGYSQVTGNLSIGGEMIRGNANNLMADIRSEIKSDSLKVNFNVSPSFRYAYLINERRTLNRETYMSSSLERKWHRLKLIAFNENENSYNRKIRYRGSLGIGAAYQLINNQNFKIDVSEIILPEAIFLEDVSRTSIRLSTRIKVAYQKSNVKFTSITLLQPSVYSLPEISLKNNFNARTTNFFEVAFAKNFSFGAGFDAVMQTYPSYIDNEVKPLDTRTYCLIKYNFK